MEKRKKQEAKLTARKITDFLRDDVENQLAKVLQNLKQGVRACPKPLHTLISENNNRSAASIAYQLESHLYHKYDKDIDYLHGFKSLQQAFVLYGQTLLQNFNYSEKSLVNFDWDEFVVETARSLGEEEGHKEFKDPTRKPVDQIFKDLNLDKQAKIVQCPLCKEWGATFRRVRTRGSDEPDDTPCECKCGHKWTQFS